MSSKVNHPSHYTQATTEASRPALKTLGATNFQIDNLECIDAMEDVFGPTAVYWWCVCSAFKYLSRAGLKRPWYMKFFAWLLRRIGCRKDRLLGSKIDYQKARWCLSYAIDIDPMPVPETVKANVKSALELIP